MFKQLVSGAKKLALGPEPAPPAPAPDLFPKVTPAVDGDDCLRDCDSCSLRYPRGFKIDEHDDLYGGVRGWATHVLVATGKSDWARDVADEEGSVMQALSKAHEPTNGRLMLSAADIPTPHHTSEYSEPTTVLLLPAFILIENVTPAAVPTLVSEYINKAPTSSDPLAPVGLPAALPAPRALAVRPSPHRALVLLCSHRTRDARCAQSAPLLRAELARHLRPLGLFREPGDERPGGVAVYFISHMGGHKYSANVLVYRRPGAFGPGAAAPAEDVGAAQCIWLARVKPQDIEGIVKFTVLQGKVVKPESQLRGGFDRSRGLLSW